MSKCTTESCAGGHPDDRDFYVTVRDGKRTGWLLGPYADHQQALDEVSRARQLAERADARAHFYEFGTASVEGGTNIATVFGR